jgi:hypothetical protein
LYIATFILEDRSSNFSDMHTGLWQVLEKLTLKNATYPPLTYNDIFDTTSSFYFTNNVLELIYGWPEAQPNHKSGASRITSLGNFKFNFENWRYLKEYNQLLGARWTFKTDLREKTQYFGGTITYTEYEDAVKKFYVV